MKDLIEFFLLIMMIIGFIMVGIGMFAMYAGF